LAAAIRESGNLNDEATAMAGITIAVTVGTLAYLSYTVRNLYTRSTRTKVLIEKLKVCHQFLLGGGCRTSFYVVGSGGGRAVEKSEMV
jgi:hypothetical protein